MPKDKKEELLDVLTAISVIAKRLAKKVQRGGPDHGKSKRNKRPG